MVLVPVLIIGSAFPLNPIMLEVFLLLLWKPPPRDALA
jgi:hypothetical protein